MIEYFAADSHIEEIMLWLLIEIGEGRIPTPSLLAELKRVGIKWGQTGQVNLTNNYGPFD